MYMQVLPHSGPKAVHNTVDSLWRLLVRHLVSADGDLLA